MMHAATLSTLMSMLRITKPAYPYVRATFGPLRMEVSWLGKLRNLNHILINYVK